MAIELSTWPFLIITAISDSINPCAIGVLVILVSTLIALSKDKKKLFSVGIIYITTIFIAYFLAGYGLLVGLQKANIWFLEKLGIQLSTILSWIVAIIVAAMGVVEIKDFFAYGKGFSLQISKKHAKKIMEMIHKVSIPGSIVLGFFVSMVELPCTGGPYFLFTKIISDLNATRAEVFWMMFVYNLIFVMPLFVILFIIGFGVNPEKVKHWKDDKKKWMRLFTGLLMIGLAVLLMLWEFGVIQLGTKLV